MLDFKQGISFINLFISSFLIEVKFLIQSSVLPFYWSDGKKGKRDMYIFKNRLFQCIEVNYLLVLRIFLISKKKRKKYEKLLHFFSYTYAYSIVCY